MIRCCFADNASFNEKPHVEPKKSFSAKYVGCIDVPKATGLTAFCFTELEFIQTFLCTTETKVVYER